MYPKLHNNPSACGLAEPPSNLTSKRNGHKKSNFPTTIPAPIEITVRPPNTRIAKTLDKYATHKSTSGRMRTLPGHFITTKSYFSRSIRPASDRSEFLFSIHKMNPIAIHLASAARPNYYARRSIRLRLSRTNI